jgi:hypothetical protein
MIQKCAGSSCVIHGNEGRCGESGLSTVLQFLDKELHRGWQPIWPRGMNYNGVLIAFNPEIQQVQFWGL